MAVGNTFGATALSSYGGFWISFAIVLTPGGFEIGNAYTKNGGTTLDNALGFFLAGWFIFTTILLLCTLRSTLAFFLLFFFLDIAFLLLTIAKFQPANATQINAAGGYFGLFAAFMAWYNALAGMADDR
jgi:succinate-acetate transporter protein